EKVSAAMATAEQIKGLLRSYIAGDGDQFLTISLQVAAHEARRGNTNLARDLRELIDEAKRQVARPSSRPTVPIARPAGELADLVAVSYPKTRLSDMVLAEPTRSALDRVLAEYSHQDRLRSHGLSARRKLLLVGPPGSGKTMTAAALAGELKLPLLVVRFDSVITKFMGETAAKLRQIFDAMLTTKGVYLFDEFDAIGSDRAKPNDVGEIRRVLNSFLQFLEADDSDSLIVAATNFRGLLDTALFRRFDDVIRYGEPAASHVEALLRNRLNTFDLHRVGWDKVVEQAKGLSYSEIARSAGEAAKTAILSDRSSVTTDDLLTALSERSAIRTADSDGEAHV
ncbi:MAG TPA: AAA family ATPase, partial [Pirellulaceae bacterium]|nr:AAA family ATPase [Pirellulaceae bacterium]